MDRQETRVTQEAQDLRVGLGSSDHLAHRVPLETQDHRDSRAIPDPWVQWEAVEPRDGPESRDQQETRDSPEHLVILVSRDPWETLDQQVLAVFQDLVDLKVTRVQVARLALKVHRDHRAPRVNRVQLVQQDHWE